MSMQDGFFGKKRHTIETARHAEMKDVDLTLNPKPVEGLGFRV